MCAMDRPRRASSLFLRLLAAACRVHGLDAAEILERVGLSQGHLASRDGRVPLAQARAAWDEAARQSGDPDFGLHAGERLAPDDFDVLGYFGRAAPTFGEMLGRVVQLAPLFTDDGALSLSRRPQRAVLRQAAQAPLRHVTEMMFAALVVRGRAVTGTAWLPLGASFKHRAPPDAREHARLFGPRVRFAAPADELYLSPALLDLPLKTHEPGLGAILDDYLRLVARQTGGSSDVLGDVSEAMASALPRGEPRLGDIARSLCITPRTLQRRLKDAGTSYHALLDHLRHQLAVEYLDAGQLPTSKLALLLGFSEPSAFYRAYRRWTGHSPADR